MDTIPDEELWELRAPCAPASFTSFAGVSPARRAPRRSATEAAAWRTFDEDALTLPSRGAATRGRAPLIFREAKRLRGRWPARAAGQLVFAGKAHPDDQGGQSYAQQIHEWSRAEGFEGASRSSRSTTWR